MAAFLEARGASVHPNDNGQHANGHGEATSQDEAVGFDVDGGMDARQAASYLNISRPYLYQLVSEGKIPIRDVANRPYFLCQDLQSYRKKTIADGNAAVDDMVAESQRPGLYD